jgi:hypothetical protein
MSLPAFEYNSDTIILRQDTKALRIIGAIFLILAIAMVAVFMYISPRGPLAYIIPGIEAIFGFIFISLGGVFTYTFNRTIKTFSRHIKTWIRNTTETWRYNDIKDVVLKSQYIKPKHGNGYYEYRVMVLLESGKKMKVFTHRQAAESEKVLQLIKQQIF